MDIDFRCENYRFRLRAGVLIKHGNKVLFSYIDKADYMACPGGHLHYGESFIEAVIRETKEEVGVDISNPKLIAVIENFYQGSKDTREHEIAHYFLAENCDLPEEKLHDYDFTENDEGKIVHLHFRWVDLDKIDEYDIRPTVLKKVLKGQKFDTPRHIVWRDNQEIEM